MKKKKEPEAPIGGNPRWQWWDRGKLEMRGHSMGSKRQINADIEAIDPYQPNKGDFKRGVKAGRLRRRDIFLAMHYRGAKLAEICRILNITKETATKMLGDLYAQVDKELIESPEDMKLEIGGMMLRWARKIDHKIIEEEATPMEMRVGLQALAQLAKLTGANSPELQVVKSFTTTTKVDLNKAAEQVKELETAEILSDPVMRELRMKMEMRRLEVMNGGGNQGPTQQKRITARVLPSRGEQAGGEPVPGTAAYSDDDDEPDEVGGA